MPDRAQREDVASLNTISVQLLGQPPQFTARGLGTTSSAPTRPTIPGVTDLSHEDHYMTGLEDFLAWLYALVCFSTFTCQMANAKTAASTGMRRIER